MAIEVNDEAKLRQIVKEVVRDVMEEEILKLRLLLLPYVSDEEQDEIEKSYGEPLKEIARTLILEE